MSDAIFNIVAHGTPDVEYQWLKGNQVNPEDREILIGETGPTLTINSPTISDDNTFYSCRVSNILGILYSRLAKLTVSGTVGPETPSYWTSTSGFTFP